MSFAQWSENPFGLANVHLEFRRLLPLAQGLSSGVRRCDYQDMSVLERC